MRFVSLRLTSPVTKTVTYTSLGNITSKSDVGGSYIYNQPGTARPHAVSRISGGTINGVVNPVYTYDANGNMLAGAGRAMVWTSYNKVAKLTQGTTEISYAYDDAHSRFRQVVQSGASTEETLYFGLTERKTIDGQVTWIDYVEADGKRVAQRSYDQATFNETWLYFVHDHLGSTAVVTDSSGTVLTNGDGRYSFDAWGKRRNPADGSDDPIGQYYAAGFWPTTRGFTGHEQVPEVGLVNMNARMYDPEIGRFISADTVTESLTFSQVFNRYTYVGNNPLSHTDPTGHSWLSEALDWLGGIGQDVFDFFLKNRIGQMILTIAVEALLFGVCGPGCGSALASAAITGVNGGDLGDMIMAAALTYATARAAYAVKDMIGKYNPFECLQQGCGGGTEGVPGAQSVASVPPGYQVYDEVTVVGTQGGTSLLSRIEVVWQNIKTAADYFHTYKHLLSLRAVPWIDQMHLSLQEMELTNRAVDANFMDAGYEFQLRGQMNLRMTKVGGHVNEFGFAVLPIPGGPLARATGKAGLDKLVVGGELAISGARYAGARASQIAGKAASKAFGKNGFLFGRGGKAGGGILNSNDILRIGYGWKGSAKTGSDVFRIAWGEKGGRFHGHFTLYRFRNRLP